VHGPGAHLHVRYIKRGNRSRAIIVLSLGFYTSA
jgi:hypothetical protein